MKPFNIMTIGLAGLMSITMTTAVAKNHTNETNRYYSQTVNSNPVTEKPVIEDVKKTSDFFNGSFYAKVINVMPSNMGYKLHLEGERGTEVIVNTNKFANLGEEVLFVYTEQRGEIYRFNEPEFRHFVPKNRNPK